MKPLKVAYLLGGLRPGGSERQMLYLAERLPPERFEIHFLCLIGASPYDDRARAAGAHVHLLGQPPVAGAPIRALLQRGSKVGRLVQLLISERFDIIDAWLYPADTLAALLRPIGPRVVISGRRNTDPHDRFGPFERATDAMVSRISDAIVANSQAAADHAIRTQNADPTKVRVIRNGVELHGVPSRSDRSTARAAMGVDEDSLVVGCVGNFHAIKRHALLIDAFAPLALARPELRLVLVGDGPERSALERQVADAGIQGQVRMLGTLLEPSPLYAGFDVVAQASAREGLPNVLLEAGSWGRPIVATRAGGTSEIVEDGLSGLLVPVGDRDALRSALERMISDTGLRQELGRAVHARIEECFGMARFIREFADLYEQLASRKRIDS